jgi:ATP-dependent exoDNAse (exonuclease V) alpha subunit
MRDMDDGDFVRPVEWSGQQLEALDRITDWYENSDKLVYRLAGVYGGGKTTLLPQIARRLKVKVVYGAYTGRATAVMRTKGCTDADTLDSMLYTRPRYIVCGDKTPCKKLCAGRCPHHREKYGDKALDSDSAVTGADLVIVDEGSMIARQMAKDLLSFSTPMLVAYDDFQLPPVRGEDGYFTQKPPDFRLTEVHRQASDSPVIRLATAVREGERLRLGEYGNSAVVQDIPCADMVDFDQIIVGTHRTRRSVNRRCRRELGFGGPLPEVGEKLVCLKNDRKLNLRNGTIWWVGEVSPEHRGFVDMTVCDEAGLKVNVIAPVAAFGSGPEAAELPKHPFDFGYAITCHKAQGSEWDSVLVHDESAVFRQYPRRWLYTAITRAADRVTVVR